MTSHLNSEHSGENTALSQYWRYIPALIYTVFITVLLLQPSGQPVIGQPAPPGPPSLRREILLTFGHFGVFAGLVSVWWWALLSTQSFERALRSAVIFGLVFGIVSELAQTFSINRSVSAIDAGANIAAVLLVAWVLSAYRNHR